MADIVFTPYRAGDSKHPTFRLNDFESWRSERILESWTTKSTSREGDLFIFWFGEPVLAIHGIGIQRGEVQVIDNTDLHCDWTEDERVFEADFAPLLVLDSPITLDEIKAEAALNRWWATRPFQGKPKTMLKHPAAVQRLLGMIADRNPRARKLVARYRDPKALTVASQQAPRPTDPDAQSPAKLAAVLARMDAQQRQRVWRAVELAIRDARMRADVLALWGGKCAMCGLKMYAGSSYECEVAHVRPVSDGGGDGPRNGLPLCRTHHWAFDHHLWAIRPNFRIEVRKDFRGMRAMKGLHGRPLGAPIGKRTASALLSITNVQARWADFCLRR